MLPDKSASELARTFTGLSPVGKAIFLARIAHQQTIHARATYANYANDPADVDAIALRRSNEFIHRLCGYTMQCLKRNTDGAQDASFVGMIVDVGYPVDQLWRWLVEAQNSN